MKHRSGDWSSSVPPSELHEVNSNQTAANSLQALSNSLFTYHLLPHNLSTDILIKQRTKTYTFRSFLDIVRSFCLCFINFFCFISSSFSFSRFISLIRNDNRTFRTSERTECERDFTRRLMRRTIWKPNAASHDWWSSLTVNKINKISLPSA